MDDFSPVQIAEIAVNKLTDRKPPVPFEPGLEEALTKHIEAQHIHEISKHNAGLANSLREAALSSRSQRIH
eukprot:COSAG04_NODE_27358_length_284_cov_0.605405_1_plen_70_part_01